MNTENLIVEDVVEVSDTTKSSDKHVCSPFVFEPKTAVLSVWDFLVLPSEHCGISPLRPKPYS